MKPGLSAAADAVLQGSVNRANGVPGVIAMATNASSNFYEGAFGKRDLSQPTAMTTDTVMAIFSCTKAVTGVAVMQLVEEGKIGLHDAAKKYVPEIANIMVLDGFDAQGAPKVRPLRVLATIFSTMIWLNTALLKTCPAWSVRAWPQCARCCSMTLEPRGNMAATLTGWARW
jgi:methyl acetate hydrolase